METLNIKRVTLSDLDQLQKIGRQTFLETFSAVNAEENMTKYLEEGFSVEKLTAELNHEGSEFYFAVLDHQVIGYLKLNGGQAQTDIKDHNALEIERIYVLNDYHGKKVGQLLYDKAMQVAAQKGAGYVWLGVWEENPRAIRFYQKNGFIAFDTHIFILGNEEQTDIMMKKVLNLKMKPDIQPILENENIGLYPLEENDFQALYNVAADPKIWAQHPNKDRWQKEVFRTFFDGAMQSRGAFKIVDKAIEELIGSTRFYDYNEEENSVFIGYTFYAVAYWGKRINPVVKGMMLDYIFQFISKVYFHIGAENVRSQIAIGRLGAVKVAEQEVTYFGEAPKLNFVYEITKADWQVFNI